LHGHNYVQFFSAYNEIVKLKILVWNKLFFMDNWFRWKYCFGFI